MDINELKPSKTLGSLIDAYRSIQLQRMDLSARDKKLIADQEALKQRIFEALDAQGTTACRGKIGAGSITYLEVPKVIDEKKAETWLKRKGWAHVCSRKFVVEPAAWREAKERLGADIDGIETVKLKKLSVTKA